MPKVALVTDSTAYLPPALVEKYNITVLPQVLIWGDKTYRDGIDIQPDEFYQRLEKASVMPSTSQAMPADFIKVFQNLLDQDYHVLAILVSSKLSGTISSAHQACLELAGAPVELVDSETVAMAMGFQILHAARAAEQGASLAECKALAEAARQHTGLFVTVNTLEFLHRGGRIGGGARFLGTALNLKPILEIKDGRLEAVERVRTRGKALNRLVELVEQQINGRRPLRLASLHANAAADAQSMLEKLKERMEIEEEIVSTVSPVVGTHAGPGTVGIAFMAGL
jgi:DegV family protein with EDD domain